MGRDSETRRWGQRRRRVLAGPDPRRGSGRVGGSPRESKASAGVRYKPEDGRGGRHPKEHGRQPRRWGKQRRQVLASPGPRRGSGRIRGIPRESKAGAGVRYKPADSKGGRHPEEHGRQPRRWGKQRRRVLASTYPRRGSGRVRGSPRESEVGAGVRYKPADSRGGRRPEERGRDGAHGQRGNGGEGPLRPSASP